MRHTNEPFKRASRGLFLCHIHKSDSVRALNKLRFISLVKVAPISPLWAAQDLPPLMLQI